MSNTSLESFTRFNPRSATGSGWSTKQASPRDIFKSKYENPDLTTPSEPDAMFGETPISGQQYDELMKIISLSEGGVADKYLTPMFMSTLFEDPAQDQYSNLDSDLKLASALTTLGDTDGAREIMSVYSPGLVNKNVGGNSLLNGEAQSLEDIVANIETLPLGDRETIFDQFIANETNAGKKLAAQKMKEYYTARDTGNNHIGSDFGIVNDIIARLSPDYNTEASKQNVNARKILQSKYAPYLNAFGIQ